MRARGVVAAVVGLSFAACAETKLIDGAHGVFSPDGTRVAFQSTDKDGPRVGILTLATREVTWLEKRGKSAYPAWGPDGSVAYAFLDAPETAWAAHHDGSRNGCNLRLWKDGATRPLTAGRWRDYAPSFLPDGKMLIYSSTEGEAHISTSGGQRGAHIRAVSVTGGVTRAVRTFESPQTAAVQPSISPDGRFLAWAHIGAFRDNWSIAVARASAPDAFCRLTPPEMPAYAPRWLPNEQCLVCTACREGDPGWCVYLLDGARKEMRRLAVGENPSVSPDGKTLLYDREGQLLTTDFAAARAAAPVFPLPQPDALPPPAGAPAFTFSPTKLPASFPLGMVPGDEAFYVSCEVKLEGRSKDVATLARGTYKEHALAFQLYLNDKGAPAFAMRQADGLYAGAISGKPLPLKRRYTLTGVRVGNALHLYVDGQLIANRLISQGILAPRQPLRLVVGNNVKGEVRNVTGGLGWPTGIARPPTVSEIFGE